MTAPAPRPPVARRRLEIAGAVQGVGFRPFVYRLARSLDLGGWVRNGPGGVSVEVEGPADALAAFEDRLRDECPAVARIDACTGRDLSARGVGGFDIRESTSDGAVTARVLPDLATCRDCLTEVLDPRDRRHRYPFTSCTACGPRDSILLGLPYDRAATTMRGFEMCARCRREYDDPGDRRFHAQPNACPDCGPRLALWGADGAALAGPDDALRMAGEVVRGGGVLALKGLGGFQLVVDARDAEAVARLRERKRRPHKPFAVMLPGLAAVEAVCTLSPTEAEALTGPAAPIVLLRYRDGAGPAAEVAPGLSELGVMLPATPLHHLLLRDLGFPVVATSGNLSGAPLETDETAALTRLGGIADAFLVHDRAIARPLDDSVVRVIAGRPTVLRAARGIAPVVIDLPRSVRVPAVAHGGHLKAAPAVADGRRAVLGAHVGDLDTREARAAFRGRMDDLCAFQALGLGRGWKHRLARCESAGRGRALDRNVSASACAERSGDGQAHTPHAAFRPELLYRLTGAMPGNRWHRLPPQPPDVAPAKAATTTELFKALDPKQVLLHDLHPDYATTRLALETGLPTRALQHHAAHLAACLADNAQMPPLVGVVWDGTGDGGDGTVWGGEVLNLDGQGAVTRLAHLRPFRLPGGEAAVREPRRSALGLLHAVLGDAAFDAPEIAAGFTAAERRLLRRALARGVNAPVTTSAGRLFDGLAWLLGLADLQTYEGQAAAQLEAAAVTAPSVPDDLPSLELVPACGPTMLDWAPLLTWLRGAGTRYDAGVRAAAIHAVLAGAIADLAVAFDAPRLALTGGCFQNRVLTEAAVAALRDVRVEPVRHGRVPPNDGGLALGQLALFALIEARE